jgi:hypothetical protein
MTIKASGRSALILATGLFVCFAGPSQAAGSADNATASSKPESAAGAPLALNKYTTRRSRQGKSYAHRKSNKMALRSSIRKKAAAPHVAADPRDNSTALPPPMAVAPMASSTALPPSVANANAQMASADMQFGNAKAMSARANDILQAAPDNSNDNQPAAGAPVVSADELNDVDRALQEGKTPAVTFAMAPADAPVMASSNESSTLDQTSLIGKIFMGFGALLTMASAARMFMA